MFAESEEEEATEEKEDEAMEEEEEKGIDVDEADPPLGGSEAQDSQTGENEELEKGTG